MKNIFLGFLFLAIGITSTNAQMQLSIENQTASVGEVISVPVMVKPNQNINMLAFQFAMEWDNNLLEYQSVSDFGINSLDSDDFGQPLETGKNNMLLAVWEDYPSIATFNSESTLFKVNFKVKSAFESADGATISFCTNCLTEFYDNNTNVVNVNFQNGMVQQSALPIELIDFTATLNTADVVVLQWTTANERDNSRFEIERSSDGINWGVIGKKDSNGNSNKTQHYQFLDNSPLSGTNLYRLKQVDLTRAETYSIIRQITLHQNNSILTWNNPVTNTLNIQYNALTRASLDLELFSGNGKLMKRKSFAIQEGVNLLEWNINTLPNGIYWVKANTPESVAFKIIKQ